VAAAAFLTLGLGLAPGACRAPADDDVDITFDPCAPLVIELVAGATDAERASVASGVAMWNTQAATRLTLDDVAGAPRLPLRFEKAASAFYGLYDDERGVVLVNDGFSDGHQRAVTVAHEIGHAFGLAHVERNARLSLMNNGNLHIEPTAADVTALAALWGRCGDR